MKLMLAEAVGLFAAVCGAILALGHAPLVDWLDVTMVLSKAAVLSLTCILAFYYNDLYDLRIVRSLSQFASRLLLALGVALILLAGLYTLFPDSRIADGAFLSSFLLMGGLLLPIRAVGYAIMRRRAFSDRVLIVGTGALARTLIQEIEARPHFGYAIVGIAGDGLASDEEGLPYPLYGPLEHLGKIAEEVRADRIIVALGDRRGRMPMRQLLEAEARHGVIVEDGLQTYEHFTGKLPIETLTPSFLIFSGAFRKSRLQLAGRRLVSLVAAAAGLVATAPLLAFIALAIKLDSRGPVFFIHDRAGLGGHPFRLVKFRTMRHLAGTAPQSVWQRDDSARITRVGRWLRKTRLDELPQFWNVLKGDMDLVGPRPEMLDSVKAMTEQIPYYALRHAVRPGITGWAQVRYGYSLSLEQVTEKMRHDLFYIKHMTVWLDLRILVDTVKIVLFGRGAR